MDQPDPPSRRDSKWTHFVQGATQHACVDIAQLMRGRDRPLPYALRVVLENLVRSRAEPSRIEAVRRWGAASPPTAVPLTVSRVVLPDSSGLPALMDLAALRSVLVRDGLAADAVEPLIPVDLVIDHSLIVDAAGSIDAERINTAREFERNAERYAFFKWAQQAFGRLRVVPPGMGIIHQVHLERLARVVAAEATPEGRIAYPEFVLGSDSHTPMVNALGLLAWGVGGIEAESALLGQPYPSHFRRVVGVRLTGALRPGTTTTDLALSLTQTLRQADVVGDFVEFTGPGIDTLSIPDRATLANMAPEYGATIGFFPIDARVIAYLRNTGRDDEHVNLVEACARAGGWFRTADAPEPEFSATIDFDLAAVDAVVAGPRRPDQRVPLAEAGRSFRDDLARPRAEGGFGASDRGAKANGATALDHGSIVIAAITSCTNTSNPGVMLGAGLLARNAVRRGLSVPEYVKTSLAPGSRVVQRYLASTGLLSDLEALGFHVVGYGCTTCSGKSGPLAPEVAQQIEDRDLVAAAVLSGNRNFEGRIHRLVKANYLASPMLVVAFALAGRIDIDLRHAPLGRDRGGRPVYLHDIWPSDSEIADLLARAEDSTLYRQVYRDLFEGGDVWTALSAPGGPLFSWDPTSTYILEPPFFETARQADDAPWPDRIAGARVLCLFGDSLTTDHITPAGEIPRDSLAGQYLAGLGVAPDDFNAYTQRRGNHHVMARGTFANVRTKNLLAPERDGGWTRKFPEGEIQPVYEAAEAYRAEGTPIVVIAGKNYGMGSSRDWAAKGPALLGVRLVLAESFERIHRANLIGMGILPLTFADGAGWRALGLDGTERFSFFNLGAAAETGAPVQVLAEKAGGEAVRFGAALSLFESDEAELLRQGGIFGRVYRALRADAVAEATGPTARNTAQ